MSNLNNWAEKRLNEIRRLKDSTQTHVVGTVPSRLGTGQPVYNRPRLVGR